MQIAYLTPVTLDLLADTIKAYRDGRAAYNANPDQEDDDRALVKTFGSHFDALHSWNSPAVTRESALEALRIARTEVLEEIGHGVASSMIAAALAYFEGEKLT